MKKRKYGPYKTVNGKKDRLSRQIMQEVLGRELEDYEHVYHLNGNPYDNAVENLVIIMKKKR